MYKVMLEQGDTEFVTGIDRGFLRHRTSRLSRVVEKLLAAQANLTAATLGDLLTALFAWRNNETIEYAGRGGTDGVAYRLWMEAKQMYMNRFHFNAPTPDPPIPPNCPGDVLLGVYVPPGEGHVEICHGFAYRWAIAAGKIAEDPALSAKNGPFNADLVTPVLYPLGHAGYPAARVAGAIMLRAGDIVAMFIVPPAHPPWGLGHSLIAVTPTTWFSANNAGTFGVGTGRSQIDTTVNFGIFMGHQVGWVGTENRWMRPDGIQVDVVYRRIP